MNFKSPIYIIAWVLIAIMTKWAWPHKVNLFHYKEVNQTKSHYEIEANIFLRHQSKHFDRTLYNEYEQGKGTLNTVFRIRTPDGLYQQVRLIDKRFIPAINQSKCLLNSPSQFKKYCSSKEQQPFEKQFSPANSKVDLWRIAHVIDRKKDPKQLEDISYHYSFEMCASDAECQAFHEQGKLEIKKSVFWESALIGKFNDHRLVTSILILILIVLAVVLIFLLSQLKPSKTEKLWVLAGVVALVLSPIIGGFLAWLLTLGVSEFEGGRGFAAFYLFMLLTPIVFLGLFFVFKRYLHRKNSPVEKED